MMTAVMKYLSLEIFVQTSYPLNELLSHIHPSIHPSIHSYGRPCLPCDSVTIARIAWLKR